MKRWEGFDINDIGEAMKRGVSREEFGRWLLGLWLIWKGLCDERHKQKSFHCCELQRRRDVYIEDFAAARQQAACQNRVLPLEGSIKWKSPKKGRYRLDVDYAVDDLNGRGGIGAILRDHTDKILFALAKPIAKSHTVLHGEMRAAMHGICQCIEEGKSPVEVYLDSILAVHIIEEGKEVDGGLCDDLLGFFEDVKTLNVLSFNHVRREANTAAHELARLAKSLDSIALWHENWPLWLLDIVSFDSS